MQNFGRSLKITHWVAGLALALASCVVHAKTQGQPKPNEALRSGVVAGTPAADDGLANTLLVVKLAEYGDRQKDGLSLLIAARIADGLGLRQHEVKLEPLQVTKSSQSLSRLALLARAQIYAAGRPDLLALIADAQASGSRGAQRGPWADKVTAAIVQPSEFLVTFVKGVKATFGIRGDGDSDLELEIVDAAGKKMCAPPQAGDVKSCNWVPIETAEYQIVVRNKGAAANRFTYYHN